MTTALKMNIHGLTTRDFLSEAEAAKYGDINDAQVAKLMPFISDTQNKRKAIDNNPGLNGSGRSTAVAKLHEDFKQQLEAMRTNPKIESDFKRTKAALPDSLPPVKDDAATQVRMAEIRQELRGTDPLKLQALIHGEARAGNLEVLQAIVSDPFVNSAPLVDGDYLKQQIEAALRVKFADAFDAHETVKSAKVTWQYNLNTAANAVGVFFYGSQG